MMKRIILALLLLISSVSVLFAAGTSEASLTYFPTNVVNNQKVMIDLSGTLHSEASFSFDFKNSNEKNLAIFRLRDTLTNGQTNGTSSKLSSSNVTFTSVTISSLDNWCFVHENNPTKVRPFTLDLFCVESKFTWASNIFNLASSNYASGACTKVPLNQNSTLNKSNIASIYFSNDGNSYIINVPSTDFSNNFDQFRAWYVRDFDVCIGLDNDYSTLEPGYYETRLRITATYEYYTDSSRHTTESISEEVTIRGYIGLDYEQTASQNMTYSFSVTHAADTYNMNLGLDSDGRGQSSYYDVANIKFMNVYSGTSEYGGFNNATTAKNKFVIYISPTSDYLASGNYRFRKLGTDNQLSSFKNTIEYDLYVKKSNGTYAKLSESPTSLEGAVSSDGITAVSGKNGVYSFKPYYDSRQVSSVGGRKQYVVTWEANIELFLKVADASLSVQGDASKTHNTGMYYSYVYVTLVVN